ncbi:MAG: methionyl-tRNA formyltransferase [Rickettsiales bacterium]
MRLIFMGTPAFAVPTLQALIDSAHEIAAVYTQPPRPAHRGQKETPSPVHQLAVANNLTVHTPLSLRDAAEQKICSDYKADAAIVIAYGLLLPKPILDAPRFGCINVHPSKLPRWRGAAPIQRTIMAGDKETALCIMQMEEGLDTGPVLHQENFSIPDGMTSGELHDIFANQAGAAVLATLEALERGAVKPMQQSADGVTYARKITKEEALIDWHKPAADILNLIHGLNPAPGAYFIHKGERIKIWKAQKSSTRGGMPGNLFTHPFAIQCGDDAIQPTLLQREGKKAMPVEEFLKGFSLA